MVPRRSPTIARMRGTCSRALLAVASAAFACTLTPSTQAPLGEVLLVVDTDLSVPSLVNRLRIDSYNVDGSSWYASSDLDRSHPDDWPASFAVSLADGES